MKEILLLKAEVAVDVEEGSAFQHVNFLKFFCRKTCILQYPRMVSKAWQKNLQMKWIIKKNAFDQFRQVQFIVSNTGPSVVYIIWWWNL